MDAQRRKVIETEIVTAVVHALLDRGCKLSVFSGTKHSVSRSTDMVEVLDGLFFHPEETLIVRKHRLKLGELKLVYGKCGYDVVRAYTVSNRADLISEVLNSGEVNRLINQYHAEAMGVAQAGP